MREQTRRTLALGTEAFFFLLLTAAGAAALAVVMALVVLAFWRLVERDLRPGRHGGYR
jgi:hypothetical protein